MAQSKHSLHPPITPLEPTFGERVLQSEWMQWAITHSRLGFLYISIMIGLVAFIGFMIHKRQINQESEIQMANYWAEQISGQEKLFSNDTPDSETEHNKKSAALAKLMDLVQLHPSLQAKFNPLIIQELWRQGKIQDSIVFVKDSINILQKSSLPYHAEYSAISLSIAENKFQEALDRSLKLDKELTTQASQATNQHASSLKVLQAFNQLRIAVLYSKVGQLNLCHQTIDTLKRTLSQSQKKDNHLDLLTQEELQQLSGFLREGKFSLLEFLKDNSISQTDK